MRIRKIINNNVVYSEERGETVIVIGKGIGFARKIGDHIPDDAIDQVFRTDQKNKFTSIINQLESLPDAHYEIGMEVINHALSTIGGKFNQSLFLTLTDHISFAIERFEKNQLFRNPILWDIKHYYPQELIVGQYAVRLIKTRLGIEFDENEAGFIAMHIANARYSSDMPEFLKTTTLLDQIIEYIQAYFNCKIDDDAFHFQRFIVHIRFLMARIAGGDQWDDGMPDNEYGKLISDLYPEEYHCSQDIAGFILSKFDHRMTETELGYLTVHIRNMILKNKHES